MTTCSPFAMPDLDLASLVHDLPGFVMIKDLQSNYLNANGNTLNEFGLKNADNLLGFSDLTIPHPLSENGQFYRNLDREIIQTGEAMKGICTFPFQGTVLPYQFQKIILKDVNGNAIATYSHAVACSDQLLIRIIHNLISDCPFKSNQTNNFILNKQYSGVKLSSLESQCLFYLMRQKTFPEISRQLNLPLNTIHLFVENIKTQLKVHTIAEIVEISLLKGYFNIVPPGIFQQLCRVKKHTLPINHSQPALTLNTPIKLTKRELDCAKLLVNGGRIKEIAAAIHLSPRTVETHLNNLKIKLNCRDKVELIIKLKDTFL